MPGSSTAVTTSSAPAGDGYGEDRELSFADAPCCSEVLKQLLLAIDEVVVHDIGDIIVLQVCIRFPVPGQIAGEALVRGIPFRSGQNMSQAASSTIYAVRHIMPTCQSWRMLCC